MANILGKLSPNGDLNNSQECFDRFAKTKKQKYLKFENWDTFYIKTKNNDFVEIEIEEIDTTKPWKIEEYDGAESIVVFGGIKVQDEKYNLYSW